MKKTNPKNSFLKSPRLLLFDLDKTLIKTILGSKEPWRQSFKLVYGINCSITEREINNQGLTHQKIAFQTLKKQGLTDKIIMAKMPLFLKTLAKLYNHSLKKSRVVLFPKVIPLLKELKKHHYLLGLVTGNTQAISLTKLKKTKLTPFFKLGGFGDDALERPDLVRIALKRFTQKTKFKFNPQQKNVIVIGDAKNDILAAKASKITALGVATGHYSQKALKKAGADFTLPHLQNIERFLAILKK